MSQTDTPPDLLRALIETELRERQRFAGLLHDDVLQLLAAARMALHGVEGAETARALIAQSIQRGRDLCQGLQVRYEAATVSEVVSVLLDRFRTQYGLQVAFDCPPGVVLDELAQSLVASCLHELLFNVYRHAPNGAVRGQLATHRHWTVLRVENEVPVSLQTQTFSEGMGLGALRQRVGAAQGTTQRWMDPDGWHVVSVCIPAASVPQRA